MSKKVFVTVKYRIPALHQWVGASDYLQHLHRHEFHFTVWLEVFHEDREVEFIKLKEELDLFTCGTLSEFGTQFSCEMLADSIGRWLNKTYPNRDRRVWVEEDGENGAYLSWEE